MPKYIDADLLINEINDADIITDTAKFIKDFPTADVRENVHAHWVYKALEGFPEITFPVCSNCDEDAIDYVESNFCPCCGAVMDERSEEE